MKETLSEAQLHLSRELVDDLELSRLGPEQILLKALRLARLVGDSSAQTWLRFELRGYPNTAESRPWMRYFGRLTDEKIHMGYWVPLAGVAGTAAAMQVQLQTLRVPNVQFAPSSANPHEFIGGFAGTAATAMVKPAQDVLVRLQALTSAVQTLTSIRSRVLAAVHEFAVSSYHALAFSGLAESIFEKHRVAVDGLMRAVAPDALEKVAAVSGRLAAADVEAISQAMNTLRRLIKALADRVYPARTESVEVDGQRYDVGSDKVLNRINLFLREHCPSDSRRERLNHTLRDIHERASAGAHADIGGPEARSLFLATYLVVGEILEFAPVAEEAPAAQQPDAADEAGASTEPRR